MARITVEDCLEKVDNQYDLVLLAKERTSQLNTGVAPEVPEENDKKTVISLREIGEGKVSIQDLEDSAINKLREHPEDAISSEDFDSNSKPCLPLDLMNSLALNGFPLFETKFSR